MLDPAKIATLGFVGGALALDRTAFLQTMASRPLVGATTVGYVLGDPALGLLCGLLVELLWLMDLPVGAAVPADETLAGLLAVVFAASTPPSWSSEARAALGVLVALPCGSAGRRLDIAVRRWNDRLLEGVGSAVAEGREARLGRAQLIGAARFFLAGALATVAGALAGGALVEASTARFSPEAVSALELTETVLPLIGGAAVLAGLRRRRYAALFAVGLLGGLMSTEPGTAFEWASRKLWRR